MNVLMFTNYPPHQLQDKLFVNEGWVLSLQDELKKYVTLHIAYPTKKEASFNRLEDNVYAIGYIKSSDIKNYKYINDIDIIHIMGTEFSRSLNNFIVSEELGLANKTVISMQGLVSFCAQYYLYGVPEKYQKGHSLVEVYAGFRSLKKDAYDYLNRGINEVELLRKCKHVIGRTDWDRRCVISINPNISYHYNSENLRPEFYEGKKWSDKDYEEYSIFISQATYSLKGFHHLLRVLPSIVERFPKTKVYIGGASPIAKEKWKMNSYGRFLTYLLIKGKLEDHIIFCGKMNAGQMKTRYLKSHVFLSPSNIENSSNSIAEAMMLGVPVVASNVGGTSSIVANGTDGLLYPLTETYIMAQEIIEIFGRKELAQNLSQNAIQRAEELYDREKNVKQLIGIYNKMEKER